MKEIGETLGWSVVAMDAVPDPPMSVRGGSKYESLYLAVKKLPMDESKALQVPTRDKKALYYMRAVLRKRAKRDGLRLLSSCNATRTTVWFWLVAAEPSRSKR